MLLSYGVWSLVGSLILKYSEGKELSEFLGVRIDYRILVDHKPYPEKWLEEIFAFTPYGTRWSKDGLQFPDIKPVVNPGHAYKEDRLSL